jgi:beta-lactam-binding protein with PASTA domain
MIQFAAVLLRGVIAAFTGLLIAGGTLTLAADTAAPQRPTLVAVPAGPKTLTVPQVTGQAYVFAKGILQDSGFAWRVTGAVKGYAPNTVATQQPAPGSVVLDTGAPTITLTLVRNSAYVELGTPENQAPYSGSAIRLSANVPAGAEASVPSQSRTPAAALRR